MSITFEDIKNSEIVKAYIMQADNNLAGLGYTEHNHAHALIVANRASELLKQLNYDDKYVELTKIAGYLHDIGNLINRNDHALLGGLLSTNVLSSMGMDYKDVALIASAIGNHDEDTGAPINEMAAAIILADKSDMRRSRVRNRNRETFDIHDRVNYSVTQTELLLDSEKKVIQLNLKIDTEVSAVMDYFEIFLGRMMFCRKAAEKLKLQFHLNINGQKLL